mmetsp:Transcript_10513/g.18579  ORF Transcript_10513/g.18579 Transcript_10513/m.18579 type:complete len:119 (-) Transcript_10513:499-855(-)
MVRSQEGRNARHCVYYAGDSFAKSGQGYVNGQASHVTLTKHDDVARKRQSKPCATLHFRELDDVLDLASGGKYAAVLFKSGTVKLVYVGQSSALRLVEWAVDNHPGEYVQSTNEFWST